jgi:hypothetical protein
MIQIILGEVGSGLTLFGLFWITFGMLWIFLGGVGSGKTLLMVREAVCTPNWRQNFMYGFKVNIKNYHALKVSEMMNIAEGTPKNFFIDEAYALIESRGSGSSKLSRFMSYILFQSRKRFIDFYLSAQIGGTLDCRFRRLCDYVVFCHVTPLPPADPAKFTYIIYNKHTKIPTRRILLASSAQKYYALYNSWQTVQPFDIDSIKAVLTMQENPELAEGEISELADLIEPYFKNRKITHDSVAYALFKSKKPKIYEREVYQELLLRASSEV